MQISEIFDDRYNVHKDELMVTLQIRIDWVGGVCSTQASVYCRISKPISKKDLTTFVLSIQYKGTLFTIFDRLIGYLRPFNNLLDSRDWFRFEIEREAKITLPIN